MIAGDHLTSYVDDDDFPETGVRHQSKHSVTADPVVTF